MKYVTIIAVLLLVLPSRIHAKSLINNIADTSRYAILNYNKNLDKDYGFDKDSRAATLSASDFKMIEHLINKRVTEYNNLEKKGKYPLIIHRPGKYYKQIIAVTNSKGEKEVWVNCFCSNPGSYWKKEIIYVQDGGSCYFRLKINLSKNTISDFIVNGVA